MFRAAAELLPQMVWIASGEGILEYANPRWQFCCGFHRLEDAVDWRCAIHSEDLPEELKISEKRASEMQMQMGTAMMRLMRYMLDPEVQAAQQRLGEAMMEMR